MAISSPDQINYRSLKIDSTPEWSPSRMKAADSCMKMYFLNYVLHVRQKLNAPAVRGHVIHSFIKNFWKKKDNLYVPKFLSEDSFANSVVGGLAYQTKQELESGSKPDEFFWKIDGPKFKEETREMAKLVYRRYIEEGPCISRQGNLFPMEFQIKPRLKLKDSGRVLKLNAKIDELRPSSVRDHKTGYKSISDEFIAREVQFTHYLLSIYAELQNPRSLLAEFLESHVGKSLEDFLQDFKVEIHHVPALGKIAPEQRPEISPIFQETRSVHQVQDLIERILVSEENLKKQRFPMTTDTNKCKFACSYNSSCPDFHVEDILERMFAEQNPLFIKSGLSKPKQQGFSFFQDCTCKLSPEKRSKPKQKTMRLMKATNELKL